MYLGIDIGGTKTLIAALTNEGVIHESKKFPTPTNYHEFIKELRLNVDLLTTKDFRAGCVAVPATVDRKHGSFIEGGNLHWHNEPILRDVERIAGCPMLIENDANLAGLSESMLVKDKHTKVLYITISTGIGTGFIVDQKIEPNLADSEGGQIMVQRGSRLVKWESFASGKAIYNRYHQKAADIDDPDIWQAVVKDWAVGFIDLMAITQPDVIILGGSVGHYLHKYHSALVKELKRYTSRLVAMPPIIKAERPEEAVVYGCFDLAQSVYA